MSTPILCTKFIILLRISGMNFIKSPSILFDFFFLNFHLFIFKTRYWFVLHCFSFSFYRYSILMLLLLLYINVFVTLFLCFILLLSVHIIFIATYYSFICYCDCYCYYFNLFQIKTRSLLNCIGNLLFQLLKGSVRRQINTVKTCVCFW